MRNLFKKQRISILSFGIALAGMISVGIFMQSCSSEDAINDNLIEYEGKIPVPLLNYFASSDYSDLYKNFKISTNNIDFENITIENFEDINVTLYYLPVNQNGKNTGLLCVVSKNGGDVYRGVYEDRTEMRNTYNGTTSIYTSQGFFIADFKYKKISDRKYSFRINNVTSGRFVRLKSGVEIDWPTSDDNWPTCLSKCYTAAHTACKNDPNCQFLLDMSNRVDYAGTLSIAVSCGIYCAF